MSSPTRTVRPRELGIEFEVLEGDSIVGPSIERGSWEEHETRLFRAHLAPGARVLDLGANVGWYSAVAVLAGCEVHAFEPVPAIAEVCRRNLERAQRAGPGRAVLHECAAGAAPGRARIALGAMNRGDNRVLDAGAQRPEDMGAGSLVEIRVERVDDLAPGPARVVKIDTQGSEWLALQGMRGVLAASPELALLIEFWPYALRGASPEELLRYLAKEGFTVGKASAAPYPMTTERILRQALARDRVRGGLDLYAARGVPFHVGGLARRMRAMIRSVREEG
ncbi:MAG: FkbM family methyltransferase [Planctomycetota bacterium]